AAWPGRVPDGTPVSEINGVWLNTGHGWDRNGPLSSSLTAHQVYLHDPDLLCKTECEVDWLLADLNDDGLADLYQVGAAGFFKNLGSKWADDPTPLGALDFGHGQILEDFNGDGRPDYLEAWQSIVHFPNGNLGPGQKHVHFWSSNGSHPDLLETIETWMGGT